MSTAFLYAQLPEDHTVYCRPPNALIRLGLVQPGVVWKLNKALYGLRTSPKAWEEERDEKLQNLTWTLNGRQVGLSKVDSANCVWVIKEKTHIGFQREPLGMVIAYVDDLIAVGQQDQLDGMKASLDDLYTMKTSGAIPAQYQEGIEPLKFLGCFIERLPDGEIIMHQRSYIDHCLKNNDMMMLKSAKGLPCVDEKSPPEDPYEDDGTPTSFETDKAICQKYIGQLMWLTKARGSSQHSFHVELVGGGRHAQLTHPWLLGLLLLSVCLLLSWQNQLKPVWMTFLVRSLLNSFGQTFSPRHNFSVHPREFVKTDANILLPKPV